MRRVDPGGGELLAKEDRETVISDRPHGKHFGAEIAQIDGRPAGSSSRRDHDLLEDLSALPLRYAPNGPPQGVDDVCADASDPAHRSGPLVGSGAVER